MSEAYRARLREFMGLRHDDPKFVTIVERREDAHVKDRSLEQRLL
jgi:hypothetical protein